MGHGSELRAQISFLQRIIKCNIKQTTAKLTTIVYRAAKGQIGRELRFEKICPFTMLSLQTGLRGKDTHHLVLAAKHLDTFSSGATVSENHWARNIRIQSRSEQSQAQKNTFSLQTCDQTCDLGPTARESHISQLPEFGAYGGSGTAAKTKVGDKDDFQESLETIRGKNIGSQIR